MKYLKSSNLPNTFSWLCCFTLSLIHLSCHSPIQRENRSPILITEQGEEIKLQLAITQKEQTQGLSGVKDSEFKNDQGMLFYYKQSDLRRFWMPDTYFDLDIFFLDKDFMVIDVERGVKAHPGYKVPPSIATTKSIYCQHVLELRADSTLSQKIHKGSKLNWKGPSLD